jgi:endonuclease YncB( thermonuclease family)
MAKQTSKTKKTSVRRKLAAVAAGTILLVAGTVGVVKRVITPGEKVVAVIDGDSFKIGNDQTIRLLSLNAPEIKYCMGEESRHALTKKISGKTVVLKELKTDRYGRVMAMVYLNGENVNEYMIKNGLAIHLWDNTKELKILGEANDFARGQHLGIFSPECYQTEPPEPKCPIKGSINPATKEKTYTLPDCDHYATTVVEKYKGEDWFCTELQAKQAGFTKSKNCK